VLDDQILNVMPAIDRDYVCWMAILENYREPYREHGLRKVPISCECGYSGDGNLDAWTIKCVEIDPKFWTVCGASLQYTVDFEGPLVVQVPHGITEKSLLNSDDPHERMADYISRIVVSWKGKVAPFTPEKLDDMSVVLVDILQEVVTLDPKPGVENMFAFKCPACGKDKEDFLTYLPFLSPRV
jgi:hypothetical protein